MTLWRLIRSLHCLFLSGIPLCLAILVILLILPYGCEPPVSLNRGALVDTGHYSTSGHHSTVATGGFYLVRQGDISLATPPVGQQSGQDVPQYTAGNRRSGRSIGLTVDPAKNSPAHSPIFTACGNRQFFAAVARFCLTLRKFHRIMGLTLTPEVPMAFSQYNLFGGVDPAPSEEPKTVPSELIMDILNEILPQDVVQDIVDGKATVIAVDITPAPESRPFRPAKAEWAQGLGFVSEPVDSPEDSKPSDE